MSADETQGDRAVGDLIAELTGIAQPPAFVDPAVLGRLNTAFGRVRDLAPDVYGSDPAVAGFHFQTDYFADPDDSRQLDLFNNFDSGGL